MRPHIWPLPISLLIPAALANPTMVSTSALSAAPANSGAAASGEVGRGGRVPTLTAGVAPAFGGNVTPNHGPFLGAAGRRASSCARAGAVRTKKRVAAMSVRIAGFYPHLRHP